MYTRIAIHTIALMNSWLWQCSFIFYNALHRQSQQELSFSLCSGLCVCNFVIVKCSVQFLICYDSVFLVVVVPLQLMKMSRCGLTIVCIVNILPKIRFFLFFQQNKRRKAGKIDCMHFKVWKRKPQSDIYHWHKGGRITKTRKKPKK